MRQMLGAILVMVLGGAGCIGAHRDHGDVGPDGGVPDAVTCGALTCDEVPPATCVDDDTLRRFEAACSDGACGYPSTDVACGGAGCCGDHCCTVAVSNSDVFGALQPTGLVVSPPNGTFDTSAECAAVSALGACEVVVRPELGAACVCRMDELTIGQLTVTGTRALVLLASRSVRIVGRLDVAGRGTTDGPGASYGYAQGASGSLGGAGGSFGATGAGTAASIYGADAMVPLYGGMRGQPGGGGAGGGGGGALQITAGVRIDVEGRIDASGGGGAGGVSIFSLSGGGGGGSGGGVLLEAPVVTLTGEILANGGGGGGGGGSKSGGGVGGQGYDGGNGGGGGSGYDGDGCALYGYVSGGFGGSGATSARAPSMGGWSDTVSGCFGSASFVGEGGDGGGLGRIRINTSGGCLCSGAVSPNATFGALAPE